MFTHPQFDPVAIGLGPLQIHWYGLMYVVGLLAAWWLGRVRATRPGSGWRVEELGDMIFYGAIGIIVGGRLGYVLFYDFGAFLANPLYLVQVWDGGMSFHGGLLGVIAAVWFYARRSGRHFHQVMDFVAPLTPIGLGAGRLGNFINQELWGRTTDVPWAMVFPAAGPEPRHASQLYQFALEGVVLFALVWWFSRKPRPALAVSGLFLALYGSFRFITEFFRLPDAHIGYLAWDWLTMGQLLSLPMVALGVGLLIGTYYWRRGATTTRES